MVRNIVCLLFAAMSGVLCYGQQDLDTALIQMNQVRSSPYVCYFLADSFSKAGDSVNASKCFLKADPYYLIANNVKPDNIEEELSKYKLTAGAKARYTDLFLKVYNTPETEASKKLSEMYLEDQHTRYAFSKTNDSLSNALAEKKMKKADSVHFKWLYGYVLKNGWPKPADGSAYADIIALHDPEHFCYYLKYIREAVFRGEESYKFFNTMVERCSRPTLDMRLAKYKNKTVFDISGALAGKEITPAEMEKMKKAMKDHAPVKYMFIVFESSDKKKYAQYLKDAAGYYRYCAYGIAYRLAANLATYQAELLHTDEHIRFEDQYVEALKEKPKLKLYLLY